MGTYRSRPLAGPVMAAVLACTGAGLSGCGNDLDEDNPAAPLLEEEVPNIRGSEDPGDAYRGLLDAAFREDLEAYAAQEVTVLGDVADVLSPRALTLTSPDGSDADPVLVLASPETGDVDARAGDTLVVAATVVRDLDTEAMVEEYDLDVDEDDLDDYDDDAFLVATIIEPAE